MSSEILNLFNNIADCSYLELGIHTGINFSKINAKSKFSVDIDDRHCKPMFLGTTDEYFNKLSDSEKFDIIFIDACHNYEYVLRDFNNSIDHCNKWILLHDLVPPHSGYTDKTFCGDAYKFLFYLIKEEKFTKYTCNENFGLTFIKMPAIKVQPSEYYLTASYDEFASYVDNHYKTYTPNEIVTILNGEL